MKKSHATEPVFSAKTHVLYRAAALLEEKRIPCRFTRPRKQPGILKVPPDTAEKAREILMRAFGGDGIISANEAAWFYCHICKAPVSPGIVKCPSCGKAMGDPHGR